MHTQISLAHQHYPPRVRELIDEKLHALTRFNGHLISIRAHIERLRDLHHVEIVARVRHGGVLVADAKGGAFSRALDDCLSRMSRQLKRDHDKYTRERRRFQRVAH